MTGKADHIREFKEDSKLLDIVRWLILKQIGATKDKDQIDNMKTHKLLYYAQSWHLAFFGTPLFASKIEACVKGPVVADYTSFQQKEEYEDFVNETIKRDIHELGISPEVEEHLECVFEIYGDYTGDDLSDLTHTEDPWIEARENRGIFEDTNVEITPESMQKYFLAKIKP